MSFLREPDLRDLDLRELDSVMVLHGSHKTQDHEFARSFLIHKNFTFKKRSV